MTQESKPLALASLIEGAQGETDGDKAIWIAKQLLVRARELQTPQERRQQAELSRMITQPEDKATLVEMTDQAFRTLTPARVADQLTHILDLQGVPRFFSPLEQTLLRGFQSFGEYLPGVAVPLVQQKMRSETANVILPAEEDMLSAHLKERRRQGVRMNVNFLGEALLGEDEAKRRLAGYLQAIKNPEVECISVKISTIYSQVSALAREHTIRTVADRLELLYRAAVREPFMTSAGETTSKFVYLDMEEYRDLHLTAAAMRRALDREDLLEARAGIALQAYIPDSLGVMEELLAWSRRRVSAGGEPLTIRLVKGANMEMERVEASLYGFPQAPFTTKAETDAHYKRMLRALVASENANIVRLGIASHNLFDIALGMLWAHRAGTLENVQFEMLEGMANHQRRALFECTQSMLLYAPACRQEDFLNAIGYLIRRLDENTGPSNFLRHTFELEVDSDSWQSLASSFRGALEKIDEHSAEPRRQQDRRQPPAPADVSPTWQQYRGEPDTDWALPHHAMWAEHIVATWQAKSDRHAPDVPLVIAGEEREAGATGRRESQDPSRVGVVTCRYAEATPEDVAAAVACAKADPSGWRRRPHDERHQVLRLAAHRMRERRADLIGSAMADGGKLIAEADAEVSEAIDFTEFYPLSLAPWQARAGLRLDPKGVVAVVSPWNFPLAIPCGGVAAALATGNTVLLKPASDTVLPAYLIAQCFWDAGVPKEALQFVPCSGSRGGHQLVTDPRVDVVILTGGTQTAKRMLQARPGLELIAETGGKNATIVSALSDRDLAIKHVLHSAFSHSGQKCSATSLLLLEEEVYQDKTFRETLADATRSLQVGSALDLATKVGPLIRPPRGELARGLKELEDGESWLVMPERPSANPQLFGPGIKWNVRPGGFTHATELFGPVLGVMRYRRLEDAIGIVNATGYGLTSGLESLDAREHELWRQTIRAGNLYINRPTTGAIVLRQPFGGVGSSAYGPGVKAGGPHYVLPLTNVIDTPPSVTGEEPDSHESDELTVLEIVIDQLEKNGKLEPPAADEVRQFAAGVRGARLEEFGVEHDTVQLVGQSNVRRYRSVRQLRLRVRAEDPAVDVLMAICAAVGVRCPLTVSLPVPSHHPASSAVEAFADALPRWVEVLVESEDELARAIGAGHVDRLRILGKTPLAESVVAACTDAFVSTLAEPVSANGYVEGLRYLVEQSISFDYHRYGNLGRGLD